jgi:hypothetical protein
VRGFHAPQRFRSSSPLNTWGSGRATTCSEIFAGGPRKVSQSLDVLAGKPDWDAVFDGFQATVDTLACNYWRELAAYYPDAKVVLTVRNPDSWFESASETIFSDRLQGPSSRRCRTKTAACRPTPTSACASPANISISLKARAFEGKR